jgi:hypothetical protein
MLTLLGKAGIIMVFLSSTFVLVTLNLIIQFVILSLVIYGYWLYRRLNFKRHGIVTSVAVFVQLAAFFAIMAPSFLFAILPSFIVPQPFELVSIVSLLHELAGGIAFALGIWFVASWRFRSGFAGCFGKRRHMRIAIIVWIIALSLGIALYTIFNWSILVG